MKNNWWVFFVLVVVLAGVAGVYAARSASTDIVINEIGGYTTSTHEWIEVWNKGSEPVDLTGWKFWEANTKHGITSVTGDSILVPGEFGVIVQDDAQFMRDYPNFVGSVWDSAWGSLSEGGEEVGLVDAAGAQVEKFTYIAFTNFSLERVNPFESDYTAVNWREHTGGNTVGATNSAYNIFTDTPTTTPNDTATTTPADNSTSTENNTGTAADLTRWVWIHVNEIFPHPNNGEDEWVELHNATTTDIYLAGGMLCDGRETTCTIARLEGHIPAGGFLVVRLSSSYLNNDGDTIILKNEAGGEVERVTYGGEGVPDSGESLVRFVNEDISYKVTTMPTPGAGNILQAPLKPEPKIVVSGSSGGSTSGATQTTSANKITTSTTAVRAAEPPKTTVAWSVSLPALALLNETVRLSAENSADPRGGELFVSWVFDDNTSLDGEWVERAFTTTGTKRVYIFATSTAGTTGSYMAAIPVLAKASEKNVIINEVYASTASGESEYIELANTGANDIDISGWSVVAGNDKFILPPSSTIMAGGYRALYRTATKLTLPNAGGLITLLTNKHEVADGVSIPKTSSGESFARNNDRWATTPEATPGFANIFFEVLGEKIVAEEKPQSKPKLTLSKSFAQVNTLADLKELNSGQTVIVNGVVAVMPGVFGSQTFYITDDSGSAEIYSSKKNFPVLKMGDRVRVVGAIGSGTSVERVKIKNANDVRVVGLASTTAKNVALHLVDEETVGAVVRVEGQITQVKKGLFFIDDGTDEIAVVVKPGTHILVVPKVGDTAEITGMIMRGKTGIELWPRGVEDLVLKNIKKEAAHLSNTTKDKAPYKTIVVVGGGFILAAWKWREVVASTVAKILRRG